MSGVVYSRPTGVIDWDSSDAGEAAAPDAATRVMFEPSEFLIENLELIQEVVASICRRKAMSAEEAEDFAAEVQLRLVDNDYTILRRFHGRSSFKTYIAAVVTHLYLDYRNHLWGKWHASAEATKWGDLGIELERMLNRDGKSPEEAFAALASRYPELTPQKLDDIATRLPQRIRRRMVDLDEARAVEIGPGDAIAEDAQTARRISKVVRGYIEGLPDTEQLILRLRFDSDMTVAQISRSLNVDQQSLYKRFYRCFAELRIALGKAGVAAADVAKLIGTDTAYLDFELKKRTARPSNDDESGGSDRQEETP